MLFGRFPWEMPKLPNSKLIHLEKFYDQYMEAMYGKPDAAETPDRSYEVASGVSVTND